MSGSRPTPAEQHLGDRLAALVDGELSHDARERVLAHLATCARCKAEADAQRRLKSVFAEAAPPPPTESFLARLQGLAACGGDDDEPFGGGHGFRDSPFSLAPRPTTPALPGDDGGFRIHEVGRGESDRSASRGRRFAFAAAGAVSLAAIALGGVTAGAPTLAGDSGGSGSNVTPVRAPGATVSTAAETGRRRGGAPVTKGRGGGPLATPQSRVEASAPLVPGPAPSQQLNALTAPAPADAGALDPLIYALPAAVRQLASGPADGAGSGRAGSTAAPSPSSSAQPIH
ncbi:anti-sigma factor family protein [Streptomyces sp. NPDC050560]|uniref:anti-sigma factor family protein n=1 Tax=Streptomyces sp. NPDC050560 TaxID=3365630 RepID=UPI0037BB1405